MFSINFLQISLDPINGFCGSKRLQDGCQYLTVIRFVVKKTLNFLITIKEGNDALFR